MAKNPVKTALAKGIPALAWTSLVIAVLGGTLSTGTWIGDLIRLVLGISPWPWVPPVLVAAAVIGLGLDLIIDQVPNQLAIWAALLLPSMASAIHGEIGAWITRYSKELLHAIDNSVNLAKLIGTDSTTGMAIACVVGALLMARRVVKKSKGASKTRSAVA